MLLTLVTQATRVGYFPFELQMNWPTSSFMRKLWHTSGRTAGLCRLAKQTESEKDSARETERERGRANKLQSDVKFCTFEN